jgi:6-phosphogluconate dehydrogenase
MKGDIGVIGLAVMGQNLILNMNDHGFKVVAHNRTAAKVDEFLEGPAKGTNIVGAYSLEELVEKLEAPRKVMLMVRAGDVVDTFIDKLVPLLEKATSSLMVVTLTSQTLTVVLLLFARKASISSVRVFLVVKKALVSVLLSCLAVLLKLGKRLSLSSKVSLRKLTQVSLVVIGLVTTVLVTSLRWFTMASNTVTCSLSLKHTSS